MDDDIFWPNAGPCITQIDVFGPEKFDRPIGFLADVHTDLERQRLRSPTPLTDFIRREQRRKRRRNGK